MFRQTIARPLTSANRHIASNGTRSFSALAPRMAAGDTGSPRTTSGTQRGYVVLFCCPLGFYWCCMISILYLSLQYLQRLEEERRNRTDDMTSCTSPPSLHSINANANPVTVTASPAVNKPRKVSTSAKRSRKSTSTTPYTLIGSQCRLTTPS